MFAITDSSRWACLLRIAGDLAGHAGSSLLKSCDGDEAAAEGGFAATVRRAHSCEVSLTVEDSTSLVYRHSVVDELGTIGSNPKVMNKGFMVHSVVLLDGDSG